MLAPLPSSSYDELPYDSPFIITTHPDRMAAMARLYGLTPPPVERARVLELGCANGGNLLPMAQTLPDARFVGIDLSPRQVADGRALVEALGYRHVDLRAMSILEVDDDLGRFDYIVCHGVYSWVPAEVRDKILAICRRNLVPDGVAYISYNTYPGWHQRGMVREMLLHHTRGIADPRQRVQEARAFLQLLARTAAPQDGPYAHALKHEAGLLEKSRDTYLFHEHLEEVNRPVYFSEFADHAARSGLRYLGPSRFSVFDATLAPEAQQAMERLGLDRLQKEQYVDFFMNRTFRQSLLCQAEAPAAPYPMPEALASLRLAAMARPESPGPDLRTDSPEKFVTLFGDRLTVTRPILKAALVALQRMWPRSATLDEVWAEARSLVGRDDGDVAALALLLLQGHAVSLVSLLTYDPPIAETAGERPRAGAYARHQAGVARGRPVSLRLSAPPLGDFDRLVLSLLDGARDRGALVEALARSVADGTLQVHRDGQAVVDPARVRAILAESLEPSLQQLAAEALLLRD